MTARYLDVHALVAAAAQLSPADLILGAPAGAALGRLGRCAARSRPGLPLRRPSPLSAIPRRSASPLRERAPRHDRLHRFAVSPRAQRRQ